MKNMTSKTKYDKGKVAIVILNWNGKKISVNCISSLIKHTSYKNYKIIFVDNGSTDDSVSVIKKKFPKIDVIQNKTNIGFSKGMNIGVKYAKKKYNPDFFLFLNNDIVFFKNNWLGELVSAFKEKDAGIANPLILFPNKKIQRAGSKIKNDLFTIINAVTSISEKIDERYLKTQKFREIDMFLGACFLVKKEVINKLGLLDERYSPYLIEDLEYSFRVKRGGYRIITVTTSRIIHLLHETFKKNIIQEEKKDIERGNIVVRNTFLFSLEYLGVLKSISLGMPVLFAISVIGKKNQEGGFKPSNIKFRKNLLLRVINYFKSIKDAIKLSKKGVRNN